MTESLASLIRPEQGPSLPSLARFAPPPPANLVVAELEARSRPGDVVIDLHGRGGWVARAALGRLRRVEDFESAALTRLLAEVVLRPPDLRHFDAAIGGLAAQPRGDATLRAALNDLFASRCATCGRAVVVDEFIWDGDAPAPFRKSYRCLACREGAGGGEQRGAPTDEEDAERARSLPPRGSAWEALRERFPTPDASAALPEQLLDLYTPRTLVALHALIERLDRDLRAAPIEAALRLAALHVLLPASRLNSYPGRVAALRISGGRVKPPGERQWREHNPWSLFEDGCRLVRGFLQRLEARPGGPPQARLGEDLIALAEGAANVVLRRGSAALRGNSPAAEVAGPRGAAARSRVRLVLTQPPLRWTTENLSFAYLATALVLGRDAAATLPLEPLFGQPPRSEWGSDAATIRRSFAAVAPVLAPDARVVMMLDPGGPEALVAGALGGVGAGYHLLSALLAEAGDAIGGTLEFAPPGPLAAGARTRANVPLAPLPADEGPARAFRLADVEAAVAEVAVEVLQARGEPARIERLLGEVLVGLDRLGHLQRLVGTRTFEESEARAERAAEALGFFAEPPASAAPAAGVAGPRSAAADETVGEGSGEAAAAVGEAEPAEVPRERRTANAPADSPVVRAGGDHVAMLLELIEGELHRADQPRLVESEPGRWWLRDPRDIAAAALPLSDRVEWAVFGLLSTSGGLSEPAFFDRIAGMFRGHDAPDGALIRACLESYRSRASTTDLLRTNDALQARYAEHSELVGLLAEYGHRLGLRVWIGAQERRRAYRGAPLSALLTDAEQRAYLPLVSKGDPAALGATDVVWYLRNQATILFEVEWTAMLAEPLLRRGPRIPTDGTVVRFLVILPQRTELIRFKLARSPVLRQALESGNWHVLKANHLRTLAAMDEASLDRFAPYLGLDPEIETSGEQLPLFG